MHALPSPLPSLSLTHSFTRSLCAQLRRIGSRRVRRRVAEWSNKRALCLNDRAIAAGAAELVNYSKEMMLRRVALRTDKTGGLFPFTPATRTSLLAELFALNHRCFEASLECGLRRPNVRNVS